MQNMSYGKAAQQYKQADVYGSVESANPYDLISLLFNGLTTNLIKARNAVDQSDVPAKCQAIGKSLDILDALRNGLDFEKGGQLATHLDELYEYMQRRLVVANQKSDTEVLLEVSVLLDEIKQAWISIPEAERHPQ